MSSVRLLVVAGDGAVCNRIAAAVKHPEIELVDAFSPSTVQLTRITEADANAVVLYGDQSPQLFELAERIYVSKNALCLIMVCQQPEAELLEQAIACGVSKVLRLEQIEEELALAVLQVVAREKNRAVLPAQAGTFDSRVLSVFGTKGGAGKTMFAVNLAVTLARRGKRVALLDLDLQFGDVGIFLDIQKSDSIADVAEENAFDYKSMKSYLFTHPSGVQGLCAPPSPEYAELVLPDHVSKVIGALKPNYDYVVVDMPPAFQDHSIAGLEASDQIYFLLNPDISTLRSARIGLGVLESLNVAERVHLILNKNGFSTIKQKDIEKILERPIELCIPSDVQRVIKSVNRGIPLVVGDKNSPAAKAIIGFALGNILADEAGGEKRKR